MGFSENIAKGMRVHRGAIKSAEARIGWLENELKSLKDILAGLLGSVQEGSPEGEAEENEDSLSGRGKGMTLRVDCVNQPGQAGDTVASDHQHQGVAAIFAASCNNAQAGVAFVGDIKFHEGPNRNAVSIEVAPGRNDDGTVAEVPDGDNLAVGDDRRTPTICNMDMVIAHRAVPGAGASSPNWDGAALTCAAGDCGFNNMTTREMIEAPTAATMYFAGGSLNVDCAGHIHTLERHVLLQSPAADKNPTIGTPENCCTNITFVKAISWDILETPLGSGKQFRWRLFQERGTLFIPMDSWTLSSKPTPGANEVVVVTDVDVTPLVNPNPCSCRAITVTYDTALKSVTPTSSTSLDVVTTVCYNSSTCKIQVKKTNITVLAQLPEGAAADIGPC